MGPQTGTIRRTRGERAELTSASEWDVGVEIGIIVFLSRARLRGGLPGQFVEHVLGPSIERPRDLCRCGDKFTARRFTAVADGAAGVAVELDAVKARGMEKSAFDGYPGESSPLV